MRGDRLTGCVRCGSSGVWPESRVHSVLALAAESLQNTRSRQLLKRPCFWCAASYRSIYLLSVFILFKIMAPEELFCRPFVSDFVLFATLAWACELECFLQHAAFLALSNFMFFLMIGHLLTDVSSLLLARGVNLNDNCICSPEMKG